MIVVYKKEVSLLMDLGAYTDFFLTNRCTILHLTLHVNVIYKNLK